MTLTVPLLERRICDLGPMRVRGLICNNYPGMSWAAWA